MDKNLKKILIVDDIEDNRRVIKLALRNYPYEFIDAINGEEGLLRAQEYAPDLILMDLMMPVKNGFDAITAIRADNTIGRTPILVITAYDEIENKIHALDVGATDFLAKPFDKFELRTRVSSIINIYAKFFEKEHELAEMNDRLEDLVLEKSQELASQISRDALTGLFSRAKLMADLSKITQASLLVLDIDNFGELNNCYGNDVGDQILIEFANRLRKLFGIERIYRSCADSFIVLLRDMSRDETLSVIAKIEGLIAEEPFYVSMDRGIYLGVTIGASISREGNLKSALLEADAALEFAKQSKKNSILFDRESTVLKLYRENIDWTNRIINALREDRFVVLYQPIVDSATERIVKYESLVRIEENGELISPIHFLDIAKKAKLYSEITKIVVQKSFERFKDSPYSFSINLSYLDICDEEIYSFITQHVREFPDSTRVLFEILESEGIHNYELISSFIKEVKSMGASIAVDDFGSGYSNFTHLVKLDIDILKIDGSLIREILHDDNVKKVVEAILNFSKVLNIKCIAEFVSSREIAELSKEMGVDYLQGYYYGEPGLNI